jgi:PAS domain-containing protein
METKTTYEELEQEVKELEKELFGFKRIEMELRESEEKYRGIFDESIASVYLFDDKKNFLDSNQSGLDLLGYSREELLNMSIPDVDAEMPY